MFLVDQSIPIPRLAMILIHNRLICIPHIPHLYPRLDLLFSREFQHLSNLIRRADAAAAEEDAVAGEDVGADLGEWTFGKTDLDELATDAEEFEVGCERHLRER